jgi:hypothetical protein
VKKLIIVGVVLVGLLVAADYGAAAVAEYQVSKRMQSQLVLATPPAVRIHGFPFLLQAFSGDYQQVDVDANGVTAGRLHDLGVQTNLFHVQVPLSDLVNGNVKSVAIKHVTGSASVDPQQLASLINIADLRVSTVAPNEVPGGLDQKSAVKLIGSQNVLGQRTQVTVIASLTLAGGKVVVTPEQVNVASAALPAGLKLPPAAEQAIRSAFTVQIEPAQLPFGLAPTGVRADNGRLVVDGMGNDVVIDSTTASKATG